VSTNGPDFDDVYRWLITLLILGLAPALLLWYALSR
jgi:hypothetical protein